MAVALSKLGHGPPTSAALALRPGGAARARLAAWLVLLTLTGPALLVPPVPQLALLTAVGAGSALLTGSAAASSQRRSRQTWLTVALGLASFAVANGISCGHLWWTATVLPPGTPVDVVYIAGYLCFLRGLWLLLPPTRSKDRTLAYDLALLLVALLVDVSVWLVQPVLQNGATGVASTFSFAYVGLDLALLVGVVAVVLSYERFTWSRLLVLASIAVLLGSDVAATKLMSTDGPPSWVGLGWVVATLTVAGAAAHPSRVDLHRGSALDPTSARRLGLLGLALAALGAGLLNGVGPDGPLHGALAVTAVALASGLLLRRLQLTVQAERAALAQLAERDHFRSVLLAHNNARILVVDGTGRVLFNDREALRPDAEEPESSNCFDLVHPDDHGVVTTMLSQVSGRTVTGQVRLVRGTQVRHAEVTATDLRSDPAVRGVVLNVRDVEERRAYEQKLYLQATTDALTGLANRFLLMQELAAQVARPQAPGWQLVLMLGDLDEFKAVNDSLGHASGDELLRVVSERLRASCRDALVVARLGGDEFAALFLRPVPTVDIQAELGRTLDAVGRPVVMGDRALRPSMSAGVALLAPDDTAESALWKADAAMYLAKRSGQALAVFDDALDGSIRRQRDLQRDLQTVLSDGGLCVVYQPVVGGASNDIVGCEALLRWQHPVYGAVPPDEFIPYAEQVGVIAVIGRWVLLQACHEAAGWGAGSELSIAVNVSPTQLKAPSFAEDVAHALRVTGLRPDRLVLEITEEVFLDAGATLRVLHDLKRLGARIAVDDFGTGYSSLSYLQQLPIDQLKIDRSFVSRLDEPEGAAVVDLIISLARALGLEVVAEGVEAPAQAAWLRDRGPLFMQGYLFSRPVPPAAVRALLADRRSDADAPGAPAARVPRQPAPHQLRAPDRTRLAPAGARLAGGPTAEERHRPPPRGDGRDDLR